MSFPKMVKIAVSELKDRLQQDYERTYPGMGEIIRVVLDAEEANARKLSSFPHLFLPDLVEVHIATLGLEPSDRRHDDILSSKAVLVSRLRCPSSER